MRRVVIMINVCVGKEIWNVVPQSPRCAKASHHLMQVARLVELRQCRKVVLRVGAFDGARELHSIDGDAGFRAALKKFMGRFTHHGAVTNINACADVTAQVDGRTRGGGKTMREKSDKFLACFNGATRLRLNIKRDV